MSTAAPPALSRARWPWLVLLALVAGALVVAAVDTTDDGGLRGLYRSVKCPQCQGQSVADSDSPAARAIRQSIADQKADGATDQEVRDFLVERYGDEVLLTPSRSGITGLIWFLPVAAFVFAVAGLAAVFRRWRTEPVSTASDDDRRLVADALRGPPTADD